MFFGLSLKVQLMQMPRYLNELTNLMEKGRGQIRCGKHAKLQRGFYFRSNREMNFY